MSTTPETPETRIQPTFRLIDGSQLPGQPIDPADYDAFKRHFEAALREGRLVDQLADTTIDLVPSSVLYISWDVVHGG